MWFSAKKEQPLRIFIVLKNRVHQKNHFLLPIMLGYIKARDSEKWKSQSIIEMNQWKLKI